MANLIRISDQEIQEIMSLNPTYSSTKVLKKMKRERSLKDYHSTLVLLVEELGFSILMKQNSKYTGWIPYFDFKPNNLLKEETGKYTLIEGSLKSIEKCQRRLTQDAVYRLMQVSNIEHLLLQRNFLKQDS